MRIIAGSVKGRRLLGPGSTGGTRPTADRVRQALFDVLGQWCDGLRVLDLYSGTGALAFEALSRGASGATLVERSREAIGLCRKNAETLGFTTNVELLAMPVGAAIEVLVRRGAAFDLVFVDPPYALEAGAATLKALDEGRLVAEGGVVVVEHAKAEVLPAAQGGLRVEDERRFGETVVSIFRLTGP